MKSRIRLLAPAALLACASSPLLAQNLDGALSAYKANDFPEAAARFYEVLKFDSDEGNQAEAEYGLAQSFQKMGLHLPAIRYYENIIQSGNSHTYFFRAFESILDSADAIEDDRLVPQILDRNYDKRLAKLESGILQRIHYTLGELAYRQSHAKDARDFLKTVKPGNKTYAKAQYLLALMKLGMGQKSKNLEPDREGALVHFQNILKEIPAGASQPEVARLRVLATFGVARVSYEEAARMEEDDPKRKEKLADAMAAYDDVERLGPDWAQAMFEKAYTNFQLNEYGQALGNMHTLTSPSMTDHYQPELHVLRSLVYYFSCHYDRVYKVLTSFEEEYRPMLDALKKVNAEERDADFWYELMAKSVEQAQAGNNATDLVPARISLALARDEQWRKHHGSVVETERQLKKVKSTGALSDGPLGEELVQMLEDARKNFVKIAGKYAQRASKAQEDQLQGFINQGTLVRLETQSAEQGWLEAGRKLQAGVIRRRLPRPFIPDDTYIYWSWRDEYWADEVGFYRYAIKSECID